MKGRGNSSLLETGTLYVANLKAGQWVALTIDAVTKAISAASFKAPSGVKGTVICHTNNDAHGNIHGHITRIFESGDDLGALDFDFEIFAAGGRQSGFSSPDNLAFDSNGNLWVVTDISTSSHNKGIYKTFMNNGLFVILTYGANKGDALQFASGPVESELTGPFFTPDERTLFLSVQHPGELTEDVSKPTSLWPNRSGDKIPREGVVAIRGFKAHHLRTFQAARAWPRLRPYAERIQERDTRTDLRGQGGRE